MDKLVLHRCSAKKKSYSALGNSAIAQLHNCTIPCLMSRAPKIPFPGSRNSALEPIRLIGYNVNIICHGGRQ